MNLAKAVIHAKTTMYKQKHPERGEQKSNNNFYNFPFFKLVKSLILEGFLNQNYFDKQI